MGSGRDKRKKSKGKTPGQGEQKTAKKTERNESKAERRAAKGIEVGVTQQSSFPSYHVPAPSGRLSSIPQKQDSNKGISNSLWWRSYTLFLIQGGEDDLDALLKHFQLQDKKAKAIEIHKNADPPSARLFANFTPIHGAVSTLYSCCC